MAVTGCRFVVSAFLVALSFCLPAVAEEGKPPPDKGKEAKPAEAAEGREGGKPPTAAQIASWVKQLGAERGRDREEGAAGLFRAGDLALPALEKARAAANPAVGRAAARLLRLMAWRIHPLRPDLAFLMAGYEARPYLGKLDAIFRLERVGDARAMDVLRAVAGRDPSRRVRAYAARAADRVHFRLGGGRGDVLTVLNARGCAHLAKGEWKKALACFDKMLALDPANQTALYNKACTYARWKKTDLAVAFLERAVKAGFRDRAHMENDADLESIRKDPRYKRIVNSLPRGN